MPADHPLISIVVGTVQGWAGVARNIATWEAAALAADGELIIVDGSAEPALIAGRLGPSTRWHHAPGASIYQARQLGYGLAETAIVAVTEDHCRVAPDWALRLRAVLDATPDAVAVGGSVENGAARSIVDWASYFVVQGPLMSPIASGSVARLAGAVNVAYRRAALDGIDDFDGLGVLDQVHLQRLHQSGAKLIADDRIRVVHDQSLGLRGTTAIHFHAGRTFAGFLRHRMDTRAWLRFAAVMILPYLRLARASAIAVSRGHRPVVRRALPMMLLLLYCQAAGHVAGFVAGPGESPWRVE